MSSVAKASNTFASVMFLALMIAANYAYVRWVWPGPTPATDTAARVAIGVLLGLFNVFILGHAMRALLAARKGRLRLQFPDRPYTWGDEIAGELVLQNRRRLDLERITVTLQAERLRRDGRDDSEDWVVSFETSVDVFGVESSVVGEHRRPFRLSFPPRPPRDAQAEQAGKILDAFGPLGALLKTGLTVTSLRWKLVAEAQVPGVDLTEVCELRFNDQTLGGGAR